MQKKTWHKFIETQCKDRTGVIINEAPIYGHKSSDQLGKRIRK